MAALQPRLELQSARHESCRLYRHGHFRVQLDATIALGKGLRGLFSGSRCSNLYTSLLDAVAKIHAILIPADAVRSHWSGSFMFPSERFPSARSKNVNSGDLADEARPFEVGPLCLIQ